MSIEHEAIETIKLPYGIRVYVVPDNDAQGPDKSFDGVATIAYKGGEYRTNNCPFGRDYVVSEESFDELREQVKSGQIVATILDVRDHGSNGVHLAVHQDIDDCDALFYCSPAKALEEWGTEADKLAFTLAEQITPACQEKAVAYMKGEVETWQQWFSGEVYGIVVHNARGTVLDSCWGYYGNDDYLKSEAKEFGESEVRAERGRRKARKEEATKEAAERSYWADRGVVTAWA